MFWFFGHETCGILAPMSNPYPLHWKTKSLTYWTAREVPSYTYKSKFFKTIIGREFFPSDHIWLEFKNIFFLYLFL